NQRIADKEIQVSAENNSSALFMDLFRPANAERLNHILSLVEFSAAILLTCATIDSHNTH
ncbi:MAG TPA: hypothetical protein P5565_10295, partial [Bacteroidia bacterium]|nr:hypothetical protein [Bacteroidia bacterium]